MKRWATYSTILLVGEGAAEEAFLTHLKRLYVPRGSGLKVFVRNARGKGAKHVVEWASRQIGAYDKRAVLLDTDQDWSDAVARKAKASKIVVCKSEPHFEAMMLRLLGLSDVGSSTVLKARLAPYLNNNALNVENYSLHFGRDCLNAGRSREKAIDETLSLIGRL